MHRMSQSDWNIYIYVCQNMTVNRPSPGSRKPQQYQVTTEFHYMVHSEASRQHFSMYLHRKLYII